MIASLRGTVTHRSLQDAVIEVGGVGFQVLAPADALAKLTVGEPAEIATQMIVKEDSITLYGFTNTDERSVFNALISVNGIGPKIALAALGALGSDGIKRAVSQKDQKALTRIPGVGPKSAQRLLIELAGKLDGPTASATPEVSSGGANHETITAALVQLGWKEADAKAVVAKLDANIDTASGLRTALAWLGGRNA